MKVSSSISRTICTGWRLQMEDKEQDDCLFENADGGANQAMEGNGHLAVTEDEPQDIMATHRCERSRRADEERGTTMAVGHGLVTRSESQRYDRQIGTQRMCTEIVCILARRKN